MVDHPGIKPIPQDILMAASDALKISTLNWAAVDFDIKVLMLNNSTLLKKIYFGRTVFEKIIDTMSNTSEESLFLDFSSTTMKIATFKNIVLISIEKPKPIKLVVPWLCVVSMQDSFTSMMDGLSVI